MVLEIIIKNFTITLCTGCTRYSCILDNWKLPKALLMVGYNAQSLDVITKTVLYESLYDILAWFNARLTVDSLLGEIQQSTRRISELVKTIDINRQNSKGC